MPPPADVARRRLVVVGTGIRTAGQLTVEAIGWLRAADEVLHLVADPAAAALIRRLAPGRESSLEHFYGAAVPRTESYERMVAHITERLDAVELLVLACYGHPGVFASVPHRMIRIARAAGIPATMCAGISAEDCLFADLSIDPADAGCASFESTDFLTREVVIDPSAHLILWQVGVLGEFADRRDRPPATELVAALVEKLTEWYPADHEVSVYQASVYPGRPAVDQRLPLGDLAAATLGKGSTLYVPPARAPRRDPRLARLLPPS